MGQERINRITKILLDIMFYSGLVVFVTLPWSLKLAGKYYSENYTKHYFAMLLIFAAAGVCGIVIVEQLRRMMRTVIAGACFVYDNVRSLEIMAALSLFIAVFFIVKMFVVPTPATAVIILVFFIAALFSQVLANVFADAIRYKEENDLTI